MSPICYIGDLNEKRTSVLMLDLMKRIDEIMFTEQKFHAIVTFWPLAFGKLMIGSGYLTHTELMNEVNLGVVAKNVCIFYYRLTPHFKLKKNLTVNAPGMCCNT